MGTGRLISQWLELCVCKCLGVHVLSVAMQEECEGGVVGWAGKPKEGRETRKCLSRDKNGAQKQYSNT